VYYEEEARFTSGSDIAGDACGHHREASDTGLREFVVSPASRESGGGTGTFQDGQAKYRS
jgi:hypothetical protein